MRSRYLFAVTVVFALLGSATAMADPPAQVPVQGYLTDSQGVPLDDQTAITVKVFDAESGGSALHSEQLTVSPQAGSFTAHLGTNQPLDLAIFRDNDNLWLEVAVEGEVLEPRLRIATAPYAAAAGFAEDAAAVGGKSVSELEQPDWEDVQNKPSDLGNTYAAGDGLELNNGQFSVDPTQFQRRITSGCQSGFAVGVTKDGSLMCSEPDTAGAGDGLNKTGDTLSIDRSTVQTRVTGNCSGNKKMTGVQQDGDVDCAADDTGVASVSAGSGLSGGGSSSSVTLDVASKGIDGSHLSDDLTSSDIHFQGSGSNRSLAIPSRAVDTTEIAQNGVTSTELANGAVTNSEIANDAVTSAEIDDGTIKGQDLGTFPCDQGSSNTSFAEVTDCSTYPSPFNLPDCDEVAVGGVCEASSTDGCSNATDSNHCTDSPYEVYVRSSW